MTTLADQVHNCPVILASLDMVEFQGNHLDLRNPHPNKIASMA